MTRSNRLFAWALGLVLVVLGIMRLLTVYTNYLWMGSIGQQAVFTKLLWTQIALGVVMGVLFYVWLWFNIRRARHKPAEDVTLIGKRLLPDEDREQIELYADKALRIFCLLGGLFAGLYASAQALPLLQYLNAVPFNKTDPLFGHDVGFYIFRLPFLLYMYRTAMYFVVIALIAAVLIHLYQENIRLVGNTVHANPRARRQVLLLLGAALLIKIWGYRLAMYNLLYSNTGKVFWGASYTDVNAKLPVLWLMMAVALATAIIVLFSLTRRTFKTAGWALGVLIVVSLLGGTVYPEAIQRLVVTPNQLEKEAPYIQRNIQATRDAFGLDQVDRSIYSVRTHISNASLEASRPTLQSVRLWDYRPLETTFDMQQTLRAYYSFPGVDVDRYRVDGELRQVSISARQLDYNKVQPDWVNQHLIYTHGYGAAVSPVNESENRFPVYWVSGIPPTSTVPEMNITQPAVYYNSSALPPLIELVSSPPSLQTQSQDQGQPAAPTAPGAAPQVAPAPNSISPLAKTPPGEIPYALVNTQQPELDYPSLSSGTSTAAGSDQNKMSHYAGTGGVLLDSFLRRVAFAARFSDLQILLTTLLKPDTRIQINRYLPESLSEMAPFLIYDPDPYLVIDHGKLVWICDAYTASSRYPYATLASEISQDTVNLPGINYLRNSVKVTVDAYNGKPTLYVVDPTDPMVQCYRKIFPTLFTDAAEMPPTIRRHLRYPLLQFLTQAKVYGLYHIQNTTTFFNREDQWAVPPEIHGTSTRPTEPYYVVMKLPGAQHEQFLLMLPFVLKGREERLAVAWMAAVCDQPDYGKLVVFDFPKSPGVMGPMQFEGIIDQDPDISSKFTLWNQQGSRVVRGNTLMIPIDGNMLYIEPVYLVSTEKNAIPQLVRVIAMHGDQQPVMEHTLDQALTKLFGVELNLAAGGPQKIIVGASGAGGTGVSPVQAVTPPALAAPPAPAAPGVAPILPSGSNADLIKRANQAFAEGDAARKSGDLATYQQKMQEVGQILKQLQSGG